jgi:hypothetical protein
LFHHVMLLLGLHAYTFNKNGNAELHTTSKSSAWMVVKKALEEAAQGAGSKLQLHPDVMSNSMLSKLAMERDNPGRSESVVSEWSSGKGIKLGNLNAMAKAVLIGHAPKQGETTGLVTSVDLFQGVGMVQIDIEAALKSTRLTSVQRVLLYLLSRHAGPLLSTKHLIDAPQRTSIRKESVSKSSRDSRENEQASTTLAAGRKSSQKNKKAKVALQDHNKQLNNASSDGKESVAEGGDVKSALRVTTCMLSKRGVDVGLRLSFDLPGGCKGQGQLRIAAASEAAWAARGRAVAISSSLTGLSGGIPRLSSSMRVLSTDPPVSQASMHGNTRTMLPGSK